MVMEFSEPYYSNIVQALDLLTENPRPIGCKKLTNDDKSQKHHNYRGCNNRTSERCI